MHILIANDNDLDTLDGLLEAGGTAPWVVPKSALPGDLCAFAHGGQGIVAIGEVVSAPALAVEDPWKGRYVAQVGEVEALADPLEFEELIRMFPQWKWPTYPRMYTTPPEAIATALFDAARDNLNERPLDLDSVLAFEGAPRLRRHLVRERDRSIVIAKLQEFSERTGGLVCEVCRFDFRRAYGSLGKGFCEVHHLLPIGARDQDEVTRLEDLAVVCSNCHRMLHRGEGISIEDLRGIWERNVG
jgi:hypothetical protein